jgi:hypothetical protein
VDNVHACRPKRPVSVIEIHGTADHAIPYDGIPGGVFSSEETVAKWRSIDGCQPSPQVSSTSKVKDELWSRCDANTSVELVSLIGAGHGWFRIPGFDTTEVLWRFFAKQRMSIGARLLKVQVVYKPSRHLVVRVQLAQPASLKLQLIRGSRPVTTRNASAGAGAVKLSLSIPRSVRRGAYTLKILVQTGQAELVIRRAVRLAH